MPSVSFNRWFSKKIESGEKRQTIRPLSKRKKFIIGDRLYLFEGLRTKNCKRLNPPESLIKFDERGFPFVKIRAVDDVIIESNFNKESENYEGIVFINGVGKKDELKKIVIQEGFNDENEAEHIWINSLFKYFYENYGKNFHGVLIKW